VQTENEVKPGMGLEKSLAPTPPSGGDLPGASPRGPQTEYVRLGTRLLKDEIAGRPCYRHLGVQLTSDLYARLVEAARHEGSGTSAYVRRLIADRLGEEAVLDRKDGVRVPPAELAAASVLLGHLTTLVIASRDLTDGNASGAIAALERAHGRLVRIVERMEG
jgi:hypothetical protein